MEFVFDSNTLFSSVIKWSKEHYRLSKSPYNLTALSGSVKVMGILVARSFIDTWASIH